MSEFVIRKGMESGGRRGGGERERKGFALTRFVGSDIWKALAQFVSCVEKWYYCEKRGDETGPISLDLRLFDSDYRG